MAWQMPGQWNPGIAQMTPDLSMGPMGAYSAEQWAAVQQQNWQQWTQWQQQYSQWQSQYGEKYAEQMQSMQAMGVVPPLPPANTAPPPAPPPPEKPPPPPHENNQPLFGQSQPAPVPAPGMQTQKPHSGSSNNISIPTGNTQNWQQGNDGRNESSQQSINSEALKKLAEEERLFDIQFEKWEEEIQKWKQENVNHPDRQAYNEYEQKFETCRAQLLERRQVMKQKRARLLGQAPVAAGNVPTGNIPSTVPPPVLQNTNNNFNQNMQSQSNNTVLAQTSGQYQKQDHSQNSYNKSNNMPPQNLNNPPPNYQGNSQYAQYNNNVQSQGGYNKSNNQNTNPQDRYETYEHQSVPSDNYSSPPISHSNFLPGSRSNKGIPGLDLVPDDKAGTQDVIDMTDDNPAAEQLPPDYTTISKGINNILGDEKIMNILSMVRDQGVPQSISNNQGPQAPNQPYNSNTDGYKAAPNNQWNRNQNLPNQQFENPPPNMPFNRQGPPFSLNQNSQQDSQNYPPQRRANNDRENNMNAEPYYDRNVNFPGQNTQQRGLLPGPNMPKPRPLMQDIQSYPENNEFSRGQNMPPPRPLMQDMHNYPEDTDFSRGMQRGGPPSHGRPNMPPPRPLMENIQGMTQHDGDANNYPRGPHDNRAMNNNMNMINHVVSKPPPPPPQPARPKWVEEPLFTPSVIVEYEHKPLRLKAREFIEPVHTFDYNHKSKEDHSKKIDFEKEADELFGGKLSRFDAEDTFKSKRFDSEERFDREYPAKDFERRHPPRDEYDDRRRSDDRGFLREEYDDRRRFDDRGPPRDIYDDRRRFDERVPLRDRYDNRRIPDERGFPREEYDDRRRLDDRRRDDHERYSRRDDFSRDRGRGDREDVGYRDRQRDYQRRDDSRTRSRSRDRDSRKRGRSKESTISDSSATKKAKEPEKKAEAPKHVVMIDDLLEPPGREMRPEKIVIILRGPPGSGKSYLAKLIRDREAEHGGTARIMSIDDYFMQEGEIEEKDPVTGKIVKKPSLKYEYEAKSEETYLNSLKRAFKRSLTDGYFNFLIYDAVNDTLRSYADIWNFARQNGFQVYICTMELDPQICFKRNIHGRTLGDVQVVCTRFFPTPDHHIQLDATTLLQSAAITEVQMEDIDDEVIMEDAQEPEVESSFTSKWEKLDDAAQLARLDGTSKPLRPSQLSMADYLQLDDWKPNTAKPGKKTVRWADIEESREQEKMRAIGFVVGQTDWNRMTDPTMGSSALTQTKYIERVKRN